MLFNGEDFNLDINIVNGRFEDMLVPMEANAMKQRKAVLATQVIGSIPGDWSRGVDWPNIIASAGRMPLAEAMMQAQAAVEADQGVSAEQSFTIPIISPGQNAVSIRLLTVSPEDLEEVPKW